VVLFHKMAWHLHSGHFSAGADLAKRVERGRDDQLSSLDFVHGRSYLWRDAGGSNQNVSTLSLKGASNSNAL
jgi:hypothetical protein